MLRRLKAIANLKPKPRAHGYGLALIGRLKHPSVLLAAHLISGGHTPQGVLMKKNSQKPWFRFWAEDFLADSATASLSLDEVGALVTLWAYCWREGSIPADEVRIARLLRCESSAMAQLWPNVRVHFSELAGGDGSRLVSARINSERVAADAQRAERSESGKRGSERRWGGGGQAAKGDGSAMAQLTQSDMEGAKPSASIPRKAPKAEKRSEVVKAPKHTPTGPNAEILDEPNRVEFFRLPKVFPQGKAPNLTLAAKAFQAILATGVTAAELVECATRYVASISEPKYVTCLHAWLAGHGHLPFLDDVQAGRPASKPLAPGERDRMATLPGYDW